MITDCGIARIFAVLFAVVMAIGAAIGLRDVLSVLKVRR